LRKLIKRVQSSKTTYVQLQTAQASSFFFERSLAGEQIKGKGSQTAKQRTDESIT
jgi:hypothetical protein